MAKKAHTIPTKDTTATALDTLGELLPHDPGRDAIHIATIAVISQERLFPGQHVGMLDGSTQQVTTKAEKLIGIVDPFLAAAVYPGQMFWLLLYPRTITSLRHSWTHPDFPNEQRTDAVGAALDAIGIDAVTDALGMKRRSELLKKPTKAESEAWLRDFIDQADCPSYETVISTAIHNKNTWDKDYLHFDGQNAHGDIPDEFWDHLENAHGVKVAHRAKYFSCSC